MGPKSRIERPKKTKIGTEVAHVTHDSDTTFKVKRSKVKVTRPLCSPPCWRVFGRRGNVLALGNCCYVAVCSAAQGASAPTGEESGGTYRGGRPPTAC